MIESWLGWWRARTPRERLLLIVMFVLLATVLAWLLVVQPLAAALEDAKRRHADAVEAVGTARARAPASRAADADRTAPRPIDALVRRTAAEAGFSGARIAAQGPDRVTVAIDAARPQAFFAWVRHLEGQGVAVESLGARANQDRTLAVEAAFRVRGR